MPTHKLKQYTLLSGNIFIIIKTFHFNGKICEQDHNLHMVSVAFGCLFTNIKLNETIDICISCFYIDTESLHKILHKILYDVFHNSLDIATQ